MSFGFGVSGVSGQGQFASQIIGSLWRGISSESNRTVLATLNH